MDERSKVSPLDLSIFSDFPVDFDWFVFAVPETVGKIVVEGPSSS